MDFEKPIIAAANKDYDSNRKKELNLEQMNKARVFSRSNAPKKRSEFAQEIMEKRRKIREERDARTVRIMELENLMLQAREEKQIDVEKMENIRLELAERKNSIIASIIDRFTKNDEELYTKQMSLEEKIGNIEVAYEELESEFEALQAAFEDRAHYDAIRNDLKEFNIEQYEAYEKNLSERRIGETIDRTKAIFIHGIMPYYTPDINSPVQKWVDWKKKCEIALALEPTISASSLKPGDDYRHMWSGMGFILSDGLIEYAKGSDAASVAVNLDSRNTQGLKKPGAEEIDEAVANRKKSFTNSDVNYNEFVVRDPKLAGMFIYEGEIEDEDMARIYKTPSHQEIQTFARDAGLPLFVVKEGQVHNGRWDEEKGKLISEGKALSPAEVKNLNNQIPVVVKNEIAERIMADSPFKMFIPEIDMLRAKRTGRQQYVEYSLANTFKDNLECKYPDSKEIDESQIISSFYIPGEKVEFYKYDNAVFARRTNTHNKKTIVYQLERPFADDNTCHVGIYTYELDRNVPDKESFLEAADELVSLELERIKGDGEGKIHYNSSFLPRFAVHMFSFAEQASLQGDHGTAKRAEAIAERIMSRGEYEALQEKRTDGKGSRKIYPEDLKKYDFDSRLDG